MFDLVNQQDVNLLKELSLIREDYLYNFLKTNEECSELVQSINKFLCKLNEESKFNKGFDKIAMIHNIIEEMVDVGIQLQVLKIELLKNFINEIDFNKITFYAYTRKMKVIKEKKNFLEERRNNE